MERVERVVAGVGAFAVFERLRPPGRALMRVTAVETHTGRRLRGGLGRGFAPSRRLELVDAAVGEGGVAWVLRIGDEMSLGVRTRRGLRRVREGFGYEDGIGFVGVHDHSLSWIEDDRVRRRRLPRG